MAPLYKRYIPPKPGAAAVQTAPAASPPPPPKPAPKAAPKEEPQKRKRERTDEEVAERKAKKLRKKGIDAATVEPPTREPDQQRSKQIPQKETTQTNGAVQSKADEPPAQGDFAHIKDSRKRHRLEKEARKARIAAEKQATAGSDNAGANEEDAGNGLATRELETRGSPEMVDSIKPNAEIRDEERISEPVKRKKRRKEDEANRGAPSELALTEEKDQASAERSPTEDTSKGMSQEIPNEEREYDEKQSQPKKRRHKLESVLQQPPNGTGEDHGDDYDGEHLRKHGNIMGKFQKSQRLDEDSATRRRRDDPAPDCPKPILRDLVPLPQPEKAPTPEFIPNLNALPPWLAQPTIVADDSRSTFAELGLDPRLTQHLSKLGFQDALPVQQALLPFLLSPGTPGSQYLPGAEGVLPDLAVGAPTGSGKTIAYLVPMIEALKKTAGSGKLKALIVVPTRELVMQVAAVGESLAKGSRVKIGIATGSGNIGDEQAKITRKGRSFDPAEYRRLMDKAHTLNHPPAEHEGDDDAFEDHLQQIELLSSKEQKLIQDTVAELQDHVPTYDSAVDILVATPGRLLEHFDNTLGFSLAHVEWFILDEADKLLDGQYSNFLQIVGDELERPRNEHEQNARERCLRRQGRWPNNAETKARIVVLSATMTRDVSKLMQLRLKRPQMVVVRGKEQSGQEEAAIDSTGGFELPPTLREYSVHVGDGSEKPLFLLQILREYILADANDLVHEAGPRNTLASDEDSSSESEDESESSDSSSDTSSDSDSSDGPESAVSDADFEKPYPADNASIHPSRAAAFQQHSMPPTILAFTSSTESASRLSHLLTTLSHTPKDLRILTLTSATSSKSIHKQLSHIPTADPVLAIATDRAARGLDALASRTITHVVQYDVPRSATNYIHRVGRTARAGRVGEAWTLFTHSEARWFMNEIVKGSGVRRVGGAGVEKVRVKVEDERLRGEFADAVDGMREKVFAGGSK